MCSLLYHGCWHISKQFFTEEGGILSTHGIGAYKTLSSDILLVDGYPCHQIQSMLWCRKTTHQSCAVLLINSRFQIWPVMLCIVPFTGTWPLYVYTGKLVGCVCFSRSVSIGYHCFQVRVSCSVVWDKRRFQGNCPIMYQLPVWLSN